jgi:hypothetical protein
MQEKQPEPVDHAGHWHPDHPGRLHTFPNYAVWIGNFNQLAVDLKRVGMVVINATRRSALECFPKVPLEKALR